MLQYDWLWSGHVIIKEMFHIPMNKGNNNFTELRTILQRESQNS
jgi:hypothetical protein